MALSSQTLTVTPENVANHLRDQFASDPEWLLARRREAMAAYFALPVPTRERTAFNADRSGAITGFESAPVPADLPLPVPETRGGVLSMAHDRVLVTRQPAALAREGVILTDLRSACRMQPELVAPHLGSVIDAAHDKSQALNAGWWHNGGFLYVPAGVRVADPVIWLHYHLPDQPGFFPRSLIVLEEDSEVVLIDYYSEGENGSAPVSRTLAAMTVEVKLGSGARLHYGSIEQLSETTDAFVHRSALAGAHSAIFWNVGVFGAGVEISRQSTRLVEPGAENHSVSVFFGSGRQHHDIDVVSIHDAPHTVSTMVGKGVMKGRAQSVFTGITEIRRGARGSNARQREQTLMLSDDARADAIPSLLIDENDVFAAHSASAGPIDQAALFYLMARGLSEEAAVRMIVQGFLAPVIDNISIDDLRQQVWVAVERKVSE